MINPEKWGYFISKKQTVHGIMASRSGMLKKRGIQLGSRNIILALFFGKWAVILLC
jgi:hypothetical protein